MKTMKRATLRLTLAAAALTAAAIQGSAQTLKAEIPFYFEASGARLQPGSYSLFVNNSMGHTIVRLSGEGKSVLAVAQPWDIPAGTKASEIVLTFTCAGERCELTQLQTGNSQAYSFRAHKPPADYRIATVVVRPDFRAD
jgi:hypothetical protein